MVINILIFGFILPLQQRVYYKQSFLNKQSCIMKFEEIDGDYDYDGNLINKSTINSGSFSKEINDTFKYVNNVEFNESQNLWIIDIDTQKAINDNGNFKNIHFNMEKEVNESIDENNFPSFYKFLREREIKEITEKEEYFRYAKNNQLNITKKNINIESYENIEPTSKDLKLLSSFSSAEWMKIWLYEMVHVPDYFPTFMYQDMFRLREFSQKNTTKNYFYIGYYPGDISNKHGPYYIGVFELIPSKRDFVTHIIIQNPYHCAEKIYDNKKIMDFKKELMAMCNDATVFFKFSNLKDTSDLRYYYSWLYEE